jgi:hypothetical protein
VAAVVDEPMAEIDMECSPDEDLDEAAPFRDLPTPSTQIADEAGVAISV